MQHKWLFTCCLMLMGITLLYTHSSGNPHPLEPVWQEHPYLYIQRSEVDGIWAKAKRCDWARDELVRLRKSADEWLRKDLEFPPTTGRHSWSYVCPDCRESLETLSDTEHKCPKCGKVYSGLPYDAVLYRAKHMALAKASVNLGLASLLFDDPRYAEKSLEILLGYAERYATYPLLDVNGGQDAPGAKIMDQTLNEAGWLMEIAWAYDLVLGAGVGTEKQHQKVEDQLIRPSVATIRKSHFGTSNWQSWHNGAMATAALALQDEKLLREVLTDPEQGFFFQMENSVSQDGAWHEGSWTYHFYALNPLIRTAEACLRSGIDLYSVPKLKSMLDAPLQLLMPNGFVPALNDSTETRISGLHYEIGAARYGDPAYKSVVADSTRRGLEALIMGVENPPKADSTLTSVVLEDAGLAVLRRGEQYVSLDFGPHGGGHGHADKLSVNYYTAGQVFAPDLGRGWPYNLPIHGQWYWQTLSHNTVVVDGEPQKPSTGRMESHSFKGDYHTITASADECYDGVKMRRTVVLGERWMLDVFDVESDSEHTYDWAWHGRGEFSTALSAKPSKIEASHVSYSYLSNVREGDGSKDWQAEWTLPGGKANGLFKGSPGRTAFICDAPDNPRTDTLRCVILRDRAKTSRFVSLFSTKPMEWNDLPAELRDMIGE